MQQTLFVIPREIAGVDLFGFGWLLAVWAVASVVVLAWSLYRHGWRGETAGQMVTLGVVGFAIAFVLPVLVHPEGLLIRGYGVMMMIAVLSGVGLTVYRAQQRGIDPEIILSLAMWLFISGIVGARLFYIIEYWHMFQKPTLFETLAAMANMTEGGLVVFGSLLAAGAALVVFVHKHKLPGLALADLIAPGIVLGAAIGRIGCFLNGCCYGGISDLPWAVEFPAKSPAFADQARRGDLYLHGLIFKDSGRGPAVIEAVEADSPAAEAGLRPGQRVTLINGIKVETIDEAQFELLTTFGAGQQIAVGVAGDARLMEWTLGETVPYSRPVHPTQLYSFIDSVLLCFFLLAYDPYRRRDGELTAWLLTIHPVLRFLLEMVRVDESPVFHTGLSISQNISIALFVAGIGLWIYLLRRPVGLQWPTRLAAAGS